MLVYISVLGEMLWGNTSVWDAAEIYLHIELAREEDGDIAV